MRTPMLAALSVRFFAMSLLLAGAVAGAAPPTAAVALTTPPSPAAPFAVSGQLSGVAVVSARSAWAVGINGPGRKTLILRWNGTTWKLS